MKLGVSTYSLWKAIRRGEMDVLEAIDWIAEQGGVHVEIVPPVHLGEKPELVRQIVERAARAGIEISNYAIGGNLVTDDDAEFEAEIERLKGEVDIARALGVKLMRHDAASHSDTSMSHFMRRLPKLAEGCRRVADYAASFGITTSVENHGFFLQASDRVLALVDAVGRPNFKTTIDIGNFMCADENSVAAVKKNIGFASMIHMKDFYLRPASLNLGEGWYKTMAGNYVRGAIVGHGDIDIPEVLRIVRNSGYDGYISLEFEGMEDCREGTRIGLDNMRRWLAD
ncbi:sugar phosphate isomerase/epimerase family protein [Cohnella soli]|uniref:Sugar phosphate isomerase/epimerase family protein n=1 Tax=Cohnella soli TaxID=425005 RepID=A0ABW0HTA6_9BACL